MEIKSIETKHITEQPFKGLVETDGQFEPYYLTTIRYTHPRQGERAERVYSVTGSGASETASEQAAQESLRNTLALEANSAVTEYWNKRGVHFVDC